MMTPEEKQIICDSIFKYISSELSDWMDNEIFTKTSMENLGELYYNHVLSEVKNTDTHLLNAVIRTVKPRIAECRTQKDYYVALCKVLNFIKLPSEVWTDVEKQYDEIFIQKYNLVMQKYHTEICRIDTELNKIKTDVDAIKNATPSYSFMRDLSTDEQKLYDLCLKCNELRTRKEMLVFATDYVTSKLSDFCDMQDMQSVDIAKKKETLNLCREDAYGAEFSFSSYRDYVEIEEDDLDRPYALFYKIKLFIIGEEARKKYQYSCYTKTDDEAISECNEYLRNVPKIDDLNLWKHTDADKYNLSLQKILSDYNMINVLKNNLESSVCLRERKNILLNAVSLYEQGDFDIFNCVVPIQIEGMFADYLRDTTTFMRFTKMDIYVNAVLKDKIRYLQEIKSDIYPEAVEYFMYYFNNMIRNKIAHGRYNGNIWCPIQDEIFANELILDMMMLVHMLSRKSETDKMYRFIHGYKKYYTQVIKSSEEHQCFGALFNDMTGNKTIHEYDTIDRYRPIQVAYWLVNPYYEKIYEQVDDKKDLLELRAEFLSKEFWEYVFASLDDIIKHGYDYKNINMEFISVVNGLFKCDISQEVKQLLGKINAALKKIQELKE